MTPPRSALRCCTPARSAPSYFSRDGRSLLTAGWDGLARLWSVPEGLPLGRPMNAGEPLWSAALSPDSRTILTGGSGGTARLWHIPVQLEGDPRRIQLWAEVLTAMELDEYDVIRPLDAAAWLDRKAELEKLGGPP